MSFIIVDIQFICGNRGQCYVKELAILPHGCLIPFVYHFAPPYPREELSFKARLQNNYDFRNINGLNWNDGNIEYNQLANFLSQIKDSLIYVKGEAKEQFIRKYLPDANIQQLKIPKLSSLQQFETSCEIHGRLPQLRCAVQNCVNIYLYLLMNKIIE